MHDSTSNLSDSAGRSFWTSFSGQSGGFFIFFYLDNPRIIAASMLFVFFKMLLSDGGFLSNFQVPFRGCTICMGTSVFPTCQVP